MSRRARQIDRRSLVNSSTTEAAARNMRASPRSAIVAAAMATTRPITVITARPPLLAATAPTCRWNPLRAARPILVTEIPTSAVRGPVDPRMTGSSAPATVVGRVGCKYPPLPASAMVRLSDRLRPCRMDDLCATARLLATVVSRGIGDLGTARPRCRHVPRSAFDAAEVPWAGQYCLVGSLVLPDHLGADTPALGDCHACLPSPRPDGADSPRGSLGPLSTSYPGDAGARAVDHGCMSGDAIRALVAALADVVIEADDRKAAVVLAQLAELDGHGWLRLDELARRSYWSPGLSPFGYLADWEPVLTAGTSLAGLVAASVCRDGRVREAAVNALGRVQAPVAAAALAVRLADWVPQVRSAAWACVSARTGASDAAAVVPVVLALRARVRGQVAAARYLAKVAGGPVGTMRALAVSGDRGCELWALDALKQRDLLAADVLVDRAMGDRDPVVALWCARSLAGPSGELPAWAGLRLLASARARVRVFAAGHLGDDQLTRQVLEQSLLDRSASVRSAARWRWRRRYGDPGPVYRSALAGAGRPSQIAAALLGLDEDRDDALPAVAVPFLTHQSARVRRAAAQAIGHRADARAVIDYLVPLLGDSSGKVAVAALRHLYGYALPISVLASLRTSGTARSRRIALSIQQHSGTWSRVHADLAALNGDDRELADAARADLLAWLQHGAATSYGQPDADQAAEIARFLATSRLSDRQRRDIAFVAGISVPASGAQPD